MPRTVPSKTLWMLLLGLLLSSLAMAQEGRDWLAVGEQTLIIEKSDPAPNIDPPLMRDISLQQEQTTIPAPPPTLNARPSASRRSGISTELSHNTSPLGARPNRVDESRQKTPPNGLIYRVPPSDAQSRAATDAGNHLSKSPAAPPVWVQQRNPIVSDSRISGSRVGRIAGNGSYWVPARADLDSMLNKMDSRAIGEVRVIPGPYTSRFGPDFQFFNIDMLPSPRSDAAAYGGSTSIEYKTNGQQWFGNQTIFGSDSDWGFRLGYNHRTGNDYKSGDDGPEIPSSYHSRSFDVAFGRDLSPDQHLEFHVLRLDQTNVELPGQIFDIDYLVTNGFEVEYLHERLGGFESVAVTTWYNDTRLAGSAQRPAKHLLLPILDTFGITARTDVQGMSTGYRVEAVIEDVAAGTLWLGTDMRLLRQGLDEFATSNFAMFNLSGNSPLPRSFSANPGVFAEYVLEIDDSTRVTLGSRMDVVSTDVVDNSAKLATLGLADPGNGVFSQSLAQILATDDFNRSFLLGSAFVVGEYDLNDELTVFTGAAFAQRPPTLTELYAAQPFMFMIQNGTNSVTGDPRLDAEQLWQFDIGLKWSSGPFRGSVRGYQSWINDAITFRNAGTFDAGSVNQQVNLQYVNTKLATMSGAEIQSEYDLLPTVTGFGTMAYVEGRNQHAAGNTAEPLPMIPALKSRLGARLHEDAENPAWGLELAAQVAAAQNRVATSLLETPTPGYTTWDVRSYWRPTRNLTLVSGVENFTNKLYRTHFDYRSANGIQVFQPGINFYLGSELTY